MAEKGQWVRVHNIVLNKDERSLNLPEDTKGVPLEMWVKGFLKENGEIGDMVKVETLSGREVEGVMTEVMPTFRHNYGEFVPEILEIGRHIRKQIFGGDKFE